MSSKTPSTPTTKAATDFTQTKIGSGNRAVTVALCNAPANDATVAMKGNALQYMFVTLEPHVTTFPLSDLMVPLHAVLPTAIYSAEVEATDVGNRLCRALLCPSTSTMIGEAFYNGNAVIVNAPVEVNKRKGKDAKNRLEYIKIRSTVSLKEYNERFKRSDEVSVEFFLALPQNPVTTLDSSQLFLDGTPKKARNANGNELTAAAISSVPQSMRKACEGAETSSSGTTYTGTMDFLSSSTTFQAVFTKSPTIFKLIQKQFLPVEPSALFESAIRPIVWKIFCDNVWMDYVGTDPSEKVTPAITARNLRAIKCSEWSHVLRRNVIITPDEVMQRYLRIIPLLQAHETNTWGFHLFSLFIDSLQQDVREVLEDTKSPYYFKPPELPSVVTFADQMKHLRSVHRIACAAHAVQTANDARIRRVSKNVQTSASPPQQPQAAAFPVTGTPVASSPAAAAYVSPAETTLVRYQPPDYPVDPANQFKSKFARGFLGCLGCGEPDHRFRACPQKDVKEVKDSFHKNYLAHFPDRRKRNDDGSEYQGFLGQGPSQIPRLLVTTGLTFVATESTANKPRPMPIAVNNRMPTADFRLVCKDLHPCMDLGCLVDSCGGLNSGFIDFHCYVRDKFPECVVAFEQFNDSNPFHPIKLGGALTDQNQYEGSTHGQLTAVITYRTQFIHRDTKKPILLKFALGKDVSVNSLCGAPMLRDLGAVIDLGSDKLHLTKVNTSLPLLWSETNRGAPGASDREQPEGRGQPVTDDTRVTRKQVSHATGNHVRFSLPPAPSGPPPSPPGKAIQFQSAGQRGMDNRPAWMTEGDKKTTISATVSTLRNIDCAVAPANGVDVIADDGSRINPTPAGQSVDKPCQDSPDAITGDIPIKEVHNATSNEASFANQFNFARLPAKTTGDLMCEFSNSNHLLDFWEARLDTKQS